MKKNITFIIQGNLHKNGINNIPIYLKYGNVILSCWESDNTDEIEKLYNIKIVKQNYPADKIKYSNKQNLFFQCLTSLNGLEACETEYAIKVRCDEYYTDFKYFIKTMLSTPDNITTNNVFFRPDEVYKFHFSDHVMGGKTKMLFDMFLKVYESLLDLYQPYFAEIMLCRQYLKNKGIEPINAHSMRIMRENVNLVDIGKMGKFKISFNSSRKYYTEKEIDKFFLENKCIRSINEFISDPDNINVELNKPKLNFYPDRRIRDGGVHF